MYIHRHLADDILYIVVNNNYECSALQLFPKSSVMLKIKYIEIHATRRKNYTFSKV